ncbi:polysaccharide biosynthesis protein [Methylobacterium sp. Leaf456]|uniref:lipopolysaccharide biosynthesis protein n=1 Tax=Methylobacterium sp. Leaf456 TaxID=1736382 RepID=UPI0006FD05BC|nr:polysaccharide biosynthesis protein [Methylobacterium sp. Leaf456]KQT47657.1 polysaccharide biosynthesis protein [Methylobacterium sp. Leaf456]
MHDTAPLPLGERLRLRAQSFVRRPPAALISLADQGVVSGFGFVSGIAAARLLGIVEFGHFALILIVISFAQGLHNALITAPMMTLAGSRGSVSRIYGANILIAAFLLSVPGAVFVIFALTLSGQMSPAALIAACALMLAQNIQFTLRRLLFARGKGLRALAMDCARAAGFPVAAGLIWLQHGTVGVNGFVGMLALTSLVTSLPFMIWVGRPLLRDSASVQLGALSRRHTPIARWLLPIVFVTFAQEQLVWMVAGTSLGLDALGGLRAAQYLVGTVLILLSATENVLPVRAARAHTEGGEEALRRYVVSAGIRLGAPIVAILALLAGPAELWLTLIFGSEFAAYAGCLRILSVGVLVILVRDLAAHYFRAKQNTRVIFESLGVSMVVSLAVVVPLMQHAGVTGAAAAVTVGHIASLIYLVAAMRWQSRPVMGWLARAR